MKKWRFALVCLHSYFTWEISLIFNKRILNSRPERIQFNWVKKKRSNQIRPSKRNRGGEQENQQGQEMQCRRQDELQQPNQGLRQQQPNDIEAIETL